MKTKNVKKIIENNYCWFSITNEESTPHVEFRAGYSEFGIDFISKPMLVSEMVEDAIIGFEKELIIKLKKDLLVAIENIDKSIND